MLAAVFAESARRLGSGLHARAALRALTPAAAPGAAPGTLPDPAALRFAEDRLRDALSLHGGSPALLDALSRALVLRDRWRRLTEDRLDLEALREARDLRRTETRLRPTWPYAWSNLAATKSLLAEIDAEFAGALERAAATGPREAQVLRTVVDLGLGHWGRLPAPARRAALTALAHLAEADPAGARRIAQAHRREDLLGAGGAPDR